MTWQPGNKTRIVQYSLLEASSYYVAARCSGCIREVTSWRAVSVGAGVFSDGSALLESMNCSQTIKTEQMGFRLSALVTLVVIAMHYEFQLIQLPLNMLKHVVNGEGLFFGVKV